MTPEQQERWKAAINPLDYLDHHALNLQALAESQKRIKGRRGAPGWALELRRRCIAEGWAARENWVPEFALRSEVAMIGLPLLHPRPDDRVEVYRYLLGDFMSRALLPFVPAAPPLENLRQLCLVPRTTQEQWKEQQGQLQAALQKNHAPGKPINPAAEMYERFCLLLAAECVEIARFIYLYPPKEWWLKTGKTLVNRFCFVHHYRAEMFREEPDEGPYHAVADAFLAALEARCPPPDWLPWARLYRTERPDISGRSCETC